jgi:alpha-glucosidase
MNEASNFCNGACYHEQNAADQSQDMLKYIPTQRDLSEQSLSLEATHVNEFTELDTHSLFGHMSAYATSTWFELNQNNKRKMIIERSAYTGTSRFASRWLGDNFANADYMGYSVTGVMM